MAQFSRIQVASLMEFTGVVPLFYHPDIEVCKKIVTACYEGGARLVEFTARGDFAHEVFVELNTFVIKTFPEMAVGIGSITDAAAASLYMQSGANFVVTPVFREDIAIVCNRRKVLWAPGCGSLTEIARAEELGCEIVKLFPGGIYGPDFVRAIKKVCPWTKVMPTGGVSPERENLKAWFDAGVTCVGMGSKLIQKDDRGRFDFHKIKLHTRKSIQTIEELREE